MTRRPLVSIGMPVFESNPGFFRTAAKALLDQEFADFELVLSDNGSGPEARALYDELAATDPRVRCVHHEKNRGAAFNFNFVVEQATGEYFFWAADDDVFHPAFLARTIALLDRHPEAVSAGCRVATIDPEGRQTGLIPSAVAPSRGLRLARSLTPLEAESAFIDFYALHRLSAVRRTRGIQPFLGSDWVFFFEMLLQGPLVRSDEVLFFYRVRTDRTFEDQVERVIGGDVRAPLAVPNRGLAFEFLRLVQRSPLPRAERTACLLALSTAFLWRGWFVAEELAEVSFRLRNAVARRNYLTAAAMAVPYLALSPGAAIRPSAWKFLGRAARHLRRQD